MRAAERAPARGLTSPCRQFHYITTLEAAAETEVQRTASTDWQAASDDVTCRETHVAMVTKAGSRGGEHDTPLEVVDLFKLQTFLVYFLDEFIPKIRFAGQ